MKITEILQKKNFTISVELVPPRNGTDPEEIKEIIRKLKGKVDFVSVTKGAGGSLRGGTLPISLFAVQEGIETIAHFVCRERTKAEIENDLMDLSYVGIKNILALRGDPPAGAKDEAWDGDYEYAYQLIEHISKLNDGKYLPRKGFDEDWRDGIKTDFCIVVAGHPEDPIEQEIQHIKAKADAGAQLIITQMVFSFQDYQTYVDALKNNNIDLPVIAGIRPLTSLKQAQSMERFFGIKIPEELLAGLKTDNPKEFGLNYFADMINKLKEYKAPGVHLFLLNDLELFDEVFSRIR